MSDIDTSSFDFLIGLQSYSHEELRSLIGALEEEEKAVSKHRRLLHAKLDILRAERDRRLRDTYAAGSALVSNGDVSNLTDILASGRKRPADPEPKAVPGPETDPKPHGHHPIEARPPAEKDNAEAVRVAVKGIQKRFRDLSVDVREERLIRYIIKQVRQGRHVDEVMADPYMVTHTSEATRARLLQHPAVLKGIEGEIRSQFADYSSSTGRKPGGEADS